MAAPIYWTRSGRMDRCSPVGNSEQTWLYCGNASDTRSGGCRPSQVRRRYIFFRTSPKGWVLNQYSGESQGYGCLGWNFVLRRARLHQDGTKPALYRSDLQRKCFQDGFGATWQAPCSRLFLRDHQIYNAMNKLVPLLVMTTLTAGCSDNYPKATIEFHKIYRSPQGFVFEFKSDINFDELHASNKHQKVVRKFLTCSLSNDEDLDIEHQLQYDFIGNIEPATQPSDPERELFHYSSIGDFHENTSSSSSNLLRGTSLRRLLDSKKAIPCRVIMTVYLSSPYYSKVMLVPTDAIKVAAMK